MKKAFVFVVCGDESHIKTLNFSLKYLRHFSKEEIIVVTDLSRNKAAIDHDKIVDISTAKSYNNHQASIYLKTGLFKFLPKGYLYCYLDSDVLAINKDCDDIFKEYIAPISFAADHCTINSFSPIAMNCACEKRIEEASKEFSLFLDLHKHKFNDPLLDKSQEKTLLKQFELIKSSFFKKIFFKLKFSLSKKYVWVNSNFYFDKTKGTWFDKNKTPIIHHIPIDKLADKYKFEYDPNKEQWLNQLGNSFWTIECNHLVEAIYKDFKVNITNKYWQHWNGGVFLFNQDSEDFLSYWHHRTLEAFELPNWKLRDQGTLALSAWKFKLENHALLEKKWNFLADDNNKDLCFDGNGYFSENNWITKHKVNFVHVYHRFGDKTWDLWNYIANIKLND